jgi:hypothetical protein
LRLLYHWRSKNDNNSMSSKGAEAISSMGNDTPLAIFRSTTAAL